MTAINVTYACGHQQLIKDVLLGHHWPDRPAQVRLTRDCPECERARMNSLDELLERSGGLAGEEGAP